jgi:hypothetical protein
MNPPFGPLTPYELFSDITTLTTRDEVERIRTHCQHYQHQPVIDRYRGNWCWHTLIDTQSQQRWEKPIALAFRVAARAKPEQRLTTAVVAKLRAHGAAVECNVLCAVGTADIVSSMRDVVYEVKARLTRAALFQAVGQVLLYRQCINPEARAVIVGRPTAETALFLPWVAALGITVVCWEESSAED